MENVFRKEKLKMVCFFDDFQPQKHYSQKRKTIQKNNC